MILQQQKKKLSVRKEARAWLNGEGYIAVTETTSQFKYWHEAYHGGRLAKEANEG